MNNFLVQDTHLRFPYYVNFNDGKNETAIPVNGDQYRILYNWLQNIKKEERYKGYEKAVSDFNDMNMMDEWHTDNYTPTIEEVLNDYLAQPEDREEVQRSLIHIKTKTWDEGFDQGVQYGMGRLANKNPYRSEQ